MPLIINWIEQQNQAINCIEMSLFEENFSIHYVDNVIVKTEWNLASLDKQVSVNDQWKELQLYFNNPIKSLTINLKKQGSAFRNKVWAEMCKIPIGQTLTYSALAKQINSGARAVANACRDNPFPGIIPCHRVVAVSGLGGYMGQTSGRSLDIKRKLLAAEMMLANN